ncbi:MAG TPA: tetratricopeptide repeat protein [Pyrinomonadaceae bacterium]|nr:tetratricopeptide repeat protein [Pyrinomonadaceae bacterium]
MNVILFRIILTTFTLLCLFQLGFAQTKEKSTPDKKIVAPTVSVAKCNKTTKNAEAEKLCNSGLNLIVQQKLDQAISAFTKAIELDPTYDDAYNHRGDAYNWKKDYDLAIGDLTKAIEINPKRLYLYIHRGSTYFIEGKRYELAIADYTKAIELNPKNDSLYRMRAMIYDAAGHKDLADADLQKAKELRQQPK